MIRKPKIRCIECRKRYVDEDSVCINVCSKCLYGEDEFANCEESEWIAKKKLKYSKMN